MAEAFREITEWANGTKNGIYLFEADKALAFCNYKGEITKFANPIQIDKRGRKFEKVKSPFNIVVKSDPALIEIKGSKGETYYINKEEGTCSCPGFRFRKTCRHIEGIRNA